MENKNLQKQAEYHNQQAEYAHAQKTAFERGEIYSLSGSHAADHDDWLKEMVVHFATVESEHLAIRDSFLAKIMAAS